MKGYRNFIGAAIMPFTLSSLYRQSTKRKIGDSVFIVTKWNHLTIIDKLGKILDIL